jgi:ABC-type nitrate/sulfonate/bicarbonate transport system substrate-binding protein
MKFRGASLASAVALIFLIAGCGGPGNGAGLPAPEKPNIVVDAFPAIDSAGLYIAQMDHLFTAQGLNVTIPPRDVRFDSNVAFPAVAASLQSGKIGAAFAPEPFVSLDEQNYGIQELADLDQGSTVDFPIQGYAVTQAWADKYPHTLAAFLRALSRARRSPTRTGPPWNSRWASTCRFRGRPRRSSRCRASRPGWIPRGFSAW